MNKMHSTEITAAEYGVGVMSDTLRDLRGDLLELQNQQYALQDDIEELSSQIDVLEHKQQGTAKDDKNIICPHCHNSFGTVTARGYNWQEYLCYVCNIKQEIAV